MRANEAFRWSVTRRALARIWPAMALSLAYLPLAVQAADTASMSIDDVASLTSDSAPAQAAVTPIRANELRELALPLGSHKGLADRSAQLLAELDARAARLDTMYRFGALVNKDGVLPPVISEGRDAIESTPDQVRRADAQLRVVAPARMVTIPPSWRDYLYVGLRTKAQVDPMPFSAMLPKTSAERAYWREQVMLGYKQGQELAEQILNANLARLNRDYLGMLRYSEMLHRGMFDRPQVAVAPQVVSGDRTQLNVGDTLYRITDHGGFVTDSRKWRASIAPGESSTPADALKGGDAVAQPIASPAITASGLPIGDKK